MTPRTLSSRSLSRLGRPPLQPMIYAGLWILTATALAPLVAAEESAAQEDAAQENADPQNADPKNADPGNTSEAPEENDPPPGLGVWHAQIGKLSISESVLPGRPISAVPWPGGGLAVLSIETEAERNKADDAKTPGDELPRSLFRVVGAAQDLEPIATGLDPIYDTVHSTGSDSSELWIGGDGVLARLSDDGQVVPFLEQPGLDLDAMALGNLVTDDGFWVPDVGVLRHYSPRGELLGEMPLPASAERRRRRLVLRSPKVTRLDDGTLIGGPDIADKTRSRHLFLGLEGEEDEPTEAWSRLPRPEDIEQSWYALLDGQPVFIAATTQADRMGVFEKLELRVFRLRADRTRAGRTTLFKTDSETIHWYRFEPKFLDWNGDDREDLLLVQPDGMSPGNLVIELFQARAGRFNPKPRRSKIDAESATWHLGEDFDGDGLPELVVGTGALSLYRGVEHRRRVIEKKPWIELTRSALRDAKTALAEVDEPFETTEDRPSFRGRIRVGDITGDGRADIAVVRRSEGRAVIRIVEVAP